MIKNITLGQYFPGTSVVHRLDPRTKLLLALAIIVLIFMANTWISYLSISVLIFMAILVSKISPLYLLKGLKPVWFLILFTFVLNVFFYSGGVVLWQWGIIKVYQDGLFKAVQLAVRLVLLISATTTLTLTTSPMQLTEAIERLLAPLKKIKFPVTELALMMSIALRFIPTLVEETDRIMKAQTARGANFTSGGLIKRAKALIPLLIPLFVSAFKRADELALAMESRCFGAGERTRMKVLKYTKIDLFAAFTLLLPIAVIVLGAYL